MTNKINPEKSKIGLYNNEEIDFETALSVTEFGKYNIFITIACGICVFAVNTTVYGIGYILPAAECDLNLKTTEKGLLTSVAFIGIICSLYLWGVIADTTGRKNVILISLIGSFACNLAATFTSTFWLFTLFIFLNGVFISGASSAIYAYLGEFHSNPKRSKSVAWCSVFTAVAILLLPVLAWITISQTFSFLILELKFLPWRLYLILTSAPSLMAAIAIAFFPESPKFLVLEGRVPEALDILRTIYETNTKKKEFPIKAINPITNLNKNSRSKLMVLQNMCLQTKSLFEGEHLKYTMVTCFLQFGVFAISSGLLLWYPDILDKLADSYGRHPNSTFTVCEALTLGHHQKEVFLDNCEEMIVDYTVYQQNVIIGVAYLLGCTTVGALIDFVGKRLLLVITLVITAFACILLPFITSTVVIDVLFVLALVPPGMCVGIINAVVVDIFPTHLKAMAVSSCLMMGRLGSVAASSIIGFLLELSCEGTFYAYGVLVLGCVGLSFLIPQNRYA